MKAKATQQQPQEVHVVSAHDVEISKPQFYIIEGLLICILVALILILKKLPSRE